MRLVMWVGGRVLGGGIIRVGYVHMHRDLGWEF